MRGAYVLLLCSACYAASDDEAERRRPRVDAAIAQADASPPPSTTASGTVSCFYTGNPTNTCTSPSYCCFDNYTSDHNGYCTSTGTCAFGKATCDGPEDCGAGQECCAHAIRDPENGTTGFTLSCEASCGADLEVCHTTASCSSGTCSSYSYLPKTLLVCR